jgi:two-component sensor histidine kinase
MSMALKGAKVVMIRLARLDVTRGMSSAAARLFARVALGLACGLGMIGLRLLIDAWSPGAGAFALVYPAVLLATLYGRWEAGIVAYGVSFTWAWIQVLPLSVDYTVIYAQALPRVGLNALSALVVLVFAEMFRGAVTHERRRREEEIERGKVLLAELEHRTKNNFALVASLLELQKRREDSEQVRRAFDDAIGRVRTFAEAYTHLAGEQGEGVVVDMRPYLDRLVARVGSAMLPAQVAVTARVAEISLPRETAVAIGLFANEALTNCAKYAFPDGRAGKVRLSLEGNPERWRLTVQDNGVGEAAPLPQHSGGGIGTQLLTAFARQARARHATSYARGCEVSLMFDGDPG